MSSPTKPKSRSGKHRKLSGSTLRKIDSYVTSAEILNRRKWRTGYTWKGGYRHG